MPGSETGFGRRVARPARVVRAIQTSARRARDLLFRAHSVEQSRDLREELPPAAHRSGPLPQQLLDNAGQPAPAERFLRKSLLPRYGDGIILRFAVVLCFPPPPLDPTLLFK